MDDEPSTAGRRPEALVIWPLGGVRRGQGDDPPDRPSVVLELAFEKAFVRAVKAGIVPGTALKLEIADERRFIVAGWRWLQIVMAASATQFQYVRLDDGLALPHMGRRWYDRAEVLKVFSTTVCFAIGRLQHGTFSEEMLGKHFMTPDACIENIDQLARSILSRCLDEVSRPPGPRSTASGAVSSMAGGGNNAAGDILEPVMVGGVTPCSVCGERSITSEVHTIGIGDYDWCEGDPRSIRGKFPGR